MGSEMCIRDRCTHIQGFERFAEMQRLYSSEGQPLSLADTEKLKKTQKKVVLKLLRQSARNVAPKFEPGQSTHINTSTAARLKPKALLEQTIERLRKQEVSVVKPTLAPLSLYPIAKIIIDGTLANCEYTTGKNIDHVGGGTNPAMIHLLLEKIKQHYALH